MSTLVRKAFVLMIGIALIPQSETCAQINLGAQMASMYSVAAEKSKDSRNLAVSHHPMAERLSVVMNVERSGKHNFSLQTLDGTIIYSGNFKLKKGEQFFHIDVSGIDTYCIAYLKGPRDSKERAKIAIKKRS